MSCASTEPCRGRRIPGLARCTEAMKRGQQLHPSRAPGEPQSGFLGIVQVQFLDMVVDVSAVRRAQCVDKVVAVPVVLVGLPAFPACSSTRLSTCPWLLSCSTLTRWSCSFQGARREKTVLSHCCRALRKPSRSHTCSTREDGRCPCFGRSCELPQCRSWWRQPSTTVASSRNSSKSQRTSLRRDSAENCRCSASFLDKVFTWRQAVAAWRRVKEPSMTKNSSSSRAG